MPYYSSYLGNGYVGVQVSRDGTGFSPVEKLYQSDSLARTRVKSHIAGVYDGEPEKLVEIPRWSAVAFYTGGDLLTFDDPGRFVAYRQVLDMKRASFLTRYTWESNGRETDFDVSFFVSRADAHLAVLRFSFVTDYDGQVVLENRLDAEDLEAAGVCGRGVKGEMIWLEVAPPSGSVRIAEAAAVTVDQGNLMDRRTDLSLRAGISERLLLEVTAGRRCTVTKIVTFFTSYDSDDPVREAARKAAEARGQGFDSLFGAHCAAWDELWKSDIVVDNHVLQRRIHSALYHLLSSVREGQDHSIPPMGLSFEGWGGKIFWDAEFFMFPALLLLYPQLARSIVAYRRRILDVARANAMKDGYEGAAFDWATGRSGKGMGFFRDGGMCNEIHIVGEVAWAQWQYYRATRDRDFLVESAAPIILETARFWASRVVLNEEEDRYEIHGVIPPDESACGADGPRTVDNSAFTNAIARWNLWAAIGVCRILGQDVPDRWEEIADKIYVPWDSELGVFVEYDGYSGHLIKQPDVLHLVHPLDYSMSPDDVRRNFDYYKLKANWRLGHSFFPSVHPIIACRLGRREEAYELFQAWEGYFLPPFGTMRECLANEYRVFNTSFGGFLQNFIHGFGGIRVGDDGLLARPVLPAEIPRITFERLFFGGKAYRLVVETVGGKDCSELTELDTEER